MKRIILLLILILSSNLSIAVSFRSLSTENISSFQSDVTVIEITETTLANISYHQTTFDGPTKIVFTNLTSVNGNLYFHQTSNLVAVEFPLLETIKGDIYFYQNANITLADFPSLTSINGHVYFDTNVLLESISAPKLETVYDYIYIRGNTSLTSLQICNVKEILPLDSNSDPYYSISNNTEVVDSVQPCWESAAPTNLNINNQSIDENEAANTLIGTVSATPNNTNDVLTYYLTDFDFDNDKFVLIDDQLFSTVSFDFEIQNQYTVKIGVRNQFGEKSENTFTINIIDVANENINIIKILDTSLSEIYYHQTSYDSPTKIIFTNLTSVTGNVYFHQNNNLISVEFPVLENVAGHFYFSGNQSLETVDAPNLSTVFDYVYVQGNTSLSSLNICNLTEILQSDSTSDPYYYITGNTEAVDSAQPCWGSLAPSNLTLSNNTISENEDVNTLIGTISATPGNADDVLTYYLVNDFELDNDKFIVIDNELLSTQSYDFEAQEIYNVKIGVRNSFGEKTENTFTINVTDIATEQINIIEITDTTLANLHYHKVNFVGPTKLVFTNLKTVSDYVYFHQNSNLVSVELPELENTGGFFYFSGNQSTQTINAPKLASVYDYLYVEGHKLLAALNICNLSEIVQSQSGSEPYYYIKNNPILDYDSTCLTNTAIVLNYFDNIIEDDGKYLVATFNSDAGDAYVIKYFFMDEDGNETTNEDFEIIENKLYLKKELDYYDDKEFSIKVGAYRYENSAASRPTVVNAKNAVADTGLNERIEEIFQVNISGKTLNVSDFSSTNDFQIYPNPTSGLLFTEANNNEVNNFEVFNALGKKLKEVNIINNQIDLSSVPNGIYFIRIKIKDTYLARKIIKI